MKFLALVFIIGSLVLGSSAQYSFPDLCQWNSQVGTAISTFTASSQADLKTILQRLQYFLSLERPLLFSQVQNDPKNALALSALINDPVDTKNLMAVKDIFYATATIDSPIVDVCNFQNQVAAVVKNFKPVNQNNMLQLFASFVEKLGARLPVSYSNFYNNDALSKALIDKLFALEPTKMQQLQKLFGF